MKIESNFKFPNKFIQLIDPGVNGPFIAGGSALSVYEGQGVSTDVDVFFRDRDQMKRCQDRLENLIICDAYIGKTPYRKVKEDYVTDNAVTIFGADAFEKPLKRIISGFWNLSETCEATNTFRIQLICKNYYDTLDDVFANFDLTICQIGFDGLNWCATDGFKRSYAARTNDILKTDLDTIKRSMKYWVRGFEPTNLNVDDIKNLKANMSFVEGMY